MNKTLSVTVDPPDDLLFAQQTFQAGDIEDLVKYIVSLGADQCQWMVDPVWTLYRDYAGGFDFLACAIEMAHRHGLRFDAVFKPFEGGPQKVLPPALFPHIEGETLETPAGLLHAVRPFVTKHPEMRIKRRPGNYESQEPVSAIRLVKEDDAPLPFPKEQVQIWYGRNNGEFQRFDGHFTCQESLEWRPRYPYMDGPVRILTLDGLELDPLEKYIVVTAEASSQEEAFANNMDHLIELVDAAGNIIPSTPASGPVINPEGFFSKTKTFADLGLTSYLKRPEIVQQVRDKETFLAHAESMQWFNHCPLKPTRVVRRAVDAPGGGAVMRGKPMYMEGALHPIYPEVRSHWLEQIRYCMDRGADGVNIRLSQHHRPHESWEFGFNEPVLEQVEDPTNTAEIAEVNGNAYTQFLREAANLLRDADRELGAHVDGLILEPLGDSAPSPVLHNFDWQWKTWIHDIVDYVEMRGSTLLHPEQTRRAVDRIGLETRRAGIPFIYQSIRSGVHFDEPHHILERDLTFARQHSDISVYNLYETANVTRKCGEERLRGSSSVRKTVERYWGKPPGNAE